MEGEESIDQSYVMLLRLYDNAAWYMRANEKTIFIRTRRAMIRGICNAKLIDVRTKNS